MNEMIIIENSGDDTSHHYRVKINRANIDDGSIEVYFDERDSQWTKKVSGKLTGRLHDNGNGVTIELPSHENKKDDVEIKLDYCQVIEVLMLLNLCNSKSFLNKPTTFQKFIEIE